MTQIIDAAKAPIERELHVAINSPNTLGLSCDHIIGVAGNSCRNATGTLVVTNGTSESTARFFSLSDAQPLEHKDPQCAGNRQLSVSGLSSAFLYQLHLQIADDYRVPVHWERGIQGRMNGSVDTFSAPTWFAPILPRMYLNHELDQHCEENVGIPTTGFLYIFMEGYLWREIGLQANEDQSAYELKEINLDKDWGLNSRETTIDLEDDTILVPQVIDGHNIADIHIAHSQVQWSWQQIEAFGGLHPQDSRVRGREQPIATERRCTSQGRRTMARLVRDRMQPLTELLPWFNAQADHYTVHPDPGHPDHHLPRFALFNPLAIALNHTVQCMEAFKELKAEYDAVQESNLHHASGEMVHRLIFDPSLWSREGDDQWAALEADIIAPFDGRFPHLYEYRAHLEQQDPNWRQSNEIHTQIQRYIGVSRWRRNRTYTRDDNGAEFIRDLRDRLDVRKLNQGLFPNTVKDKITALDTARKRHFEWLDDQVNGVRNRTRLGDWNVPLHKALADYANLNPESDDNNWLELLHLWLVLIMPVHGRKTTVSDLYGFMNTANPAANRPTADVGRQWLDSIIDNPSHSIHRMLFPLEGNVDVEKPYDIDKAAQPHYMGSGSFIPKVFAKAVARAVAKGESEGAGPGALSPSDSAELAEATEDGDAAHSAVGAELFSEDQKTLALPLRVVDDFFNWANGVLSSDGADAARRSERLAIYVRLGQASQLASLKGMHLIKQGTEVDTEKFVVLGANKVRQEQLARKTAGQHRVNQFQAESQGMGHYTYIYDGNTGQKIGSTLISQEMNWYKGVNPPAPGEAFDAHALWARTGTDRGRGLTRITADVDVIAVDKNDYWGVEKAKLVAANDNIALGSDGHLYKGGIMGARGLGAVLSLIMLRYEYMTLMSIAGGSLDDRSKGQYYIALGTAITSLIAATGDASIATGTLIGKNELSKRLRNISFGSFRLNNNTVHLRAFKTLGTAASAVTSIMSAVDAYEYYKRQDYDASLALGLGALTGGAYAAVGIGLILNLGWAAAVPNPVMWALLAASIGFAVLAHYWRDKPLPDWVSHGPYGKDAFQGDYAVWRSNPGDCYQALLSQLISPTLALEEGTDKKSQQPALIATMTVPAFTPQADELCIHTTIETWLARHEKGDRYLSGTGHDDERFAQPYRIEQNHNEDHTRIESIQYFYRLPEIYGNYNRMSAKYRSRGQFRSAGIVLPAPYKPGLYDDLPDTPVGVDDDQLNWVHTDSITMTISQ